MKKIPDIVNRLWNVCSQMEVGALSTCGSGIIDTISMTSVSDFQPEQTSTRNCFGLDLHFQSCIQAVLMKTTTDLYHIFWAKRRAEISGQGCL